MSSTVRSSSLRRSSAANRPSSSALPRGISVRGASAAGGPSNAAIITSDLAGKSRYSTASTYSNTNVTPLNKEVSNVPISTMTATCLAALFYTISVIMILVVKCPFTREVMSFFSFLLVALLALATMAGINMIFPRYRFNCLSLSVSLLYSGSAALILYGLTETACYGLCWPTNHTPIFIPTTPMPTLSPTTKANDTQPSVVTKAFELPQSPTVPYLGNSDDETYQTIYLSREEYNGFIAGPVAAGVFKSGSVSNIFIWTFTAVGVCFQIVAHYFYG